MNKANTRQTALQGIRAVSFDLDDTFWDCDPVIVHAENKLNQWLDTHHPDVMAAHTADAVREVRSALYQTHAHLATDVTLMRKALLTQLVGERTDAEIIVDQAFDVFYRARSEVTLYDGTLEMLKALKPRYKLAAITNGNADLGLIGLAEYFHDIRRADLANPPKPAVDMFHSCCTALNIAANELLHVGDNPHTDVMGGHNAGVKTVWFNRAREVWPQELPRATIEVQSIAQLHQLLIDPD